jgi:hypothetical protein
MTDGELRGIVLQALYEARRGGQLSRVPVDPSLGLDEKTSNNIAEHLKQLGLIELFRPTSGIGSGRITARGVDVVEGRAPPSAFGITIIDNRIAVSGSSNTLNVTNSPSVTHKTVSASDNSTVTEGAKPVSKSWFTTMLSYIPGVGKILDRIFKEPS